MEAGDGRAQCNNQRGTAVDHSVGKLGRQQGQRPDTEHVHVGQSTEDHQGVDHLDVVGHDHVGHIHPCQGDIPAMAYPYIHTWSITGFLKKHFGRIFVFIMYEKRTK